jgi:UDP-glucose 4-epimerase
MSAERFARVLVTGVSTYWGGLVAQALERDQSIETVIGVDDREPTREFERTECLRVGNEQGLLRRIIDAADVDTVIDTRLTVDSAGCSRSACHENNVVGTSNILAACGYPTSPVRNLVFKSSAHYYGAEQDDPAFFTEEMRRPHPVATPIEREIVEAERSVFDFANKHPDIRVSDLRCANVLGPSVSTSHTALFSLPVVPMILGFDPRYQFVHEDDVVAALVHAGRSGLAGVYNVAADEVLAFSEAVGLLGKSYVPALPPFGTNATSVVLRRFGIDIPQEMLNQLRFGRGLDNRKLKATGFEYRYTSRETVRKFAEHLRLKPVLRGAEQPDRYEHEVDKFLRWSPNVRNPVKWRPMTAEPKPQTQLAESAQVPLSRGDMRTNRPGAGDVPVQGYDELGEEQVVSLLPSLKQGELQAIRDYELTSRARADVLAALDGLLAHETSN